MTLSMPSPTGPGFQAWLAAVLVDAAIKGTSVLLLAWLVTVLLRHTSAAVRHFVWCLAFVGMAALPILSAMLPEWPVPGLKQVIAAISSSLVEPASQNQTNVATSPAKSDDVSRSRQANTGGDSAALSASGRSSSDSLTNARVTVSDVREPEHAAAHISWRTAVPRFWLLGMMAALLPLAAGLVGQRWLTRRVRRLSDRTWLEPLEELRRYFRIWRPINLCISSRSVGPLTLGVFQPVVLIPAEARVWPLERRRVVILHELAHIRRFDVFTQICAQVVCAAYWFHPLVWFAARRMRMERETACDDLVLNAGVRASTYAQHLLEIACKSRRSVLPAAAVAGMPCGSRLESRVSSILDACRERRPMTFSTVLVAISVAFAIVAAVAAAGVEPAARSVPPRRITANSASLPKTMAQFPVVARNRTQVTTAVAATEASQQPQRRPLPGFLPAPEELPGVERWQMITAAPRGSIWAVAWRPDGKQIAFGEGGIVRVYDTISLEPARILIGHSGRITRIQWSRDGRRIASSSTDGTVRLWNEDGSPGPVLGSGEGAMRSVTWSPDGLRLAGACSDGHIYIWSTTDGMLTVRLTGHEAPVNAVAWSPDGKHIASGCDNRTVRLWDADGRPGPVMEGHTGPILSVSWSPDGRQLASTDSGFDSGNGDEPHGSSVRLWTLDGTEGPVFVGRDNGPTYSAEWSPDGRWVAFAGWDGRVRLLSADGRQSRTLDGYCYCIYSIAWNPDGTRLLTGCQQLNSRFPAQLLTWKLDSQPNRLLQTSGNPLFSVVWRPDGRGFAAACRDGNVRVWTAAGELFQVLPAGNNDIYSVDWSPDGTRLAAVCRQDRTVKVWSTETWREEVSAKHDSELRAVKWSPDSNKLAIAGDDRVATIFDPATKSFTDFRNFHRHGVTCVAWNPEGTQFASGSFDGRVRVWNLDHSAAAELEDLSSHVRAVEWSPDGTRLITGCEDNNLRLWDVDGTPGQILTGHDGYVQTVSWSPDGKRIASGSWDNTVRIWGADGSTENVLRGHGASVFSVAWQADSRKLLSASFDGTVRKWDADTGEAEFAVVLREDGTSATIGASGELLSGDPSVIDSEFVYLVETPAGAFEILKRAEFQARTSGKK